MKKERLTKHQQKLADVYEKTMETMLESELNVTEMVGILESVKFILLSYTQE